MSDTTPAVRIAEVLSSHPEVMVVERDDPTAELSLSSLTATINEALAAAPVAPGGEGERESIDDAARRLFAAHYPGRDYDALKDMVKISWMRSAWDERAALSPSREGVEPEAGAMAEVKDGKVAAPDGTYLRKDGQVVMFIKDQVPTFYVREAHPTPADDRLAVAVEALGDARSILDKIKAWTGDYRRDDETVGIFMRDLLSGRYRQKTGIELGAIRSAAKSTAEALALLTKSGEAEG